MPAKYEAATLLRTHKEDLTEIVSNSWKQRTLFALSRCRTAAMGGHIDQCNNPKCRRIHLSYNSCRNRHCPKCQGHLREQWIVAREADLLSCKYFHVVFTLPKELNMVALKEPKHFYNTLFKVAWGVLKDFSSNPKFLGAKTGMVAILHTWGQNLSLHPHLHCIVPGGGLTKTGQWKPTKSAGKYLFPVKAMRQVFRARFIKELSKHVAIDYTVRKALFSKNWVIYAKQPFFGPKQVIEYLGRYTHKIAISNHRIKSLADDKVCFSIKDYREGGKKTEMTLDQQEFIRRFSLHIMPKGFTRIRHYGILSSTSKKKVKVLVDSLIGKVKIAVKPVLKHGICRVCQKGVLETIYRFGQRGPPKHWQELLED